MKYLIEALIAMLCIALCNNGYANCHRGSFVVSINVVHTPARPGATSARGVEEYYFNERISKLLFAELIINGFTKAFIINDNSIDIPLQDQLRISKSKGTDLLISIHHDSVQPSYLAEWNVNGTTHLYCDKYKGYSIFYAKDSPRSTDSFVFATLLASELLVEGFSPTPHHAEKIKGENREIVDEMRGIYNFGELLILKVTVQGG